MFDASISDYTRQWRESRERLGLSFVGPPHSVRHSGPSRDHFLEYRDRVDIQKRGRWRNLKSVARYSKSHVYVQQMSRTPRHIREMGEQLLELWGVRGPGRLAAKQASSDTQ